MNYLIVTWLLTALATWTPMQGKTEVRMAKLNSIAEDIISVVYAEPATFKGPYAHAKMALLVGAVGARESRFEDRIQAGKCKKGECDSGRAYCYMQIHPNSGIEIVEGDREIGYSTKGYAGKDLLESQSLCIHTGTHMIRRALKYSSGKDLRAYTGETGASAPESETRFQMVRDYLAKSPPPIADADYFAADTNMQRE
jgi:hypothetical protein